MRSVPAGDFDYEPAELAANYARVRRPDPQIAAAIHAALGDAETVLNIGAGTGSYEPDDRVVIPVEPSAAMRGARPRHLAEAIDGTAEAIPLADQSVDATMATITLHQWIDLPAAARELRRVTRGPIVLLALDPQALLRFWIGDWVPSLLTGEAARHPPLDALRALLEAPGDSVSIEPIPIPLNCTDGFFEAFYGRPEQLLDPMIRISQSAWKFADPAERERGLAQFADDLASGAWDERYGALRHAPTYDGALRLIIALP